LFLCPRRARRKQTPASAPSRGVPWSSARHGKHACLICKKIKGLAPRRGAEKISAANRFLSMFY
jgi:hypothetical protein